MILKPSFLLLLSIVLTQSVFGQDKVDNYSFFKLYITNDNNEVLLVKWNDQWEIAGDRYNDPISIKEFLNKMAAGMGITIESPRLSGMYTQRWKGSPYLSILQYYQARYRGGDLKIPPDCTDIKWFGYDEALEVIPYENMKRMMKEIKDHPAKMVGAAFERYKDENNETQYVTLEDWYVMD